MEKTNFQKVAEFNTVAGVERINQPSHDIYTTHPNIVKSCVALIREEVDELLDAVNAHDLVETRDALADILYVVYGMAFRFGINADADFNLVHESNMSKFCNTEDEAKQTVAHYIALFAQGKSPYSAPTYRYEAGVKNGVDGNGIWVIYDNVTKKILKNINYKPVDLTTRLPTD